MSEQLWTVPDWTIFCKKQKSRRIGNYNNTLSDLIDVIWNVNSSALGCGFKTKNEFWIVAIAYYGVLSTKTKKSIRAKIWPLLPTGDGLFLFTKEFRNYTKENLPVQYFGSNVFSNGLIFARSLLDCHIFSALSIDAHIGYSKSHKAIWLCSHKAKLWP